MWFCPITDALAHEEPLKRRVDIGDEVRGEMDKDWRNEKEKQRVICRGDIAAGFGILDIKLAIGENDPEDFVNPIRPTEPRQKANGECSDQSGQNVRTATACGYPQMPPKEAEDFGSIRRSSLRSWV